MINYDGRIFKPLKNSSNGETSNDTIFHYKQNGNILTASYSGGFIKSGHLIGVVDASGNIDMRYHHLNFHDELMTGMCKSTPEILENGKIRLHETWQWTSGNKTSGQSVLEEQ